MRSLVFIFFGGPEEKSGVEGPPLWRDGRIIKYKIKNPFGLSRVIN